jgi:hypothetical protein
MRAESSLSSSVRLARRALAALTLAVGALGLAGCSDIEPMMSPKQVVESLETWKVKDAEGVEKLTPAALSRRAVKEPLRKRVLIAPVDTSRIAMDFGRRGAGTPEAGAAAGAATAKPGAPAAAGGASGAGTGGAAPAAGEAPKGGDAPKEGEAPKGAAPRGGEAPKGDAAPAGEGGEKAPPGRQGAYRYRRPQDGAWVAAYFRRPLYREILFSPAGNGVDGADGPPSGPAAAGGAQPGDRVEYLCPRCNRSVADRDPFCKDCGLAFLPEDAEEPKKPTPPPTVTPAPGEPTQPGEVVVGGPEPPAPPPTPRPPTTFDESRPVIYVCYQDGLPVDKDAKSCPRCFETFLIPGRKIPVPVDGGVPAGEEEEIGTLAELTVKKADEGTPRATLVPEARKLQVLIAQTIREYKIFEDIVESKDDAHLDLQNVLAFARAGDDKGGFDFIIRPVVRQWQFTYQGLTGGFWGSLFVWVAIGEPLPNSWFAVEEYKAEVVFDFELHHVRSETHIRTGWTEQIKGEVTVKVDQWDRGYYPWSLVGVPITGYVREGGYKNLHENGLSWMAFNEVQRKLCEEALYPLFGTKDWEEIDTTYPEVVSLLIGAGSFKNSHLISPLGKVNADLGTMEALLRKQLNMHNTTEQPSGNRFARLSDNTATVENVKTWVRTVLPRLAPSDFVLIYFSGYGAIEIDDTLTTPDKHRKYLVMYETDPLRLRDTALDVDFLRQELVRAKVRYVLVALDCSFAADALDSGIGLGRSLRSQVYAQQRILPGIPVEERARWFSDKERFPLLTSLGDLAKRPGGAYCQVMVAADQDQAAMEYPQLGSEGQGLFTYFLAKGIGGAADRDNGNVSITELDEFVRREVARTSAGAYGLPQDIRILGSTTMPYEFPLNRAREERRKATGAKTS